MRLWFLVFLAAFCGLRGGAQELRLLEVEVGVGRNFPQQWRGLQKKNGTNFFAELRVNRPAMFDFGVQLKGGSYGHKARGVSAKINTGFFMPTFFVDYNWRNDPERPWFFAGVGIGRQLIQNTGMLLFTDDFGVLMRDEDVNNFTITPRVGVVVFERMRIAADYAIAPNEYSCFNISVGWSIGGSYKEPYSRGRKSAKLPYGL